MCRPRSLATSGILRAGPRLVWVEEQSRDAPHRQALHLHVRGSYNKTMRERELNNGRFAMPLACKQVEKPTEGVAVVEF